MRSTLVLAAAALIALAGCSSAKPTPMTTTTSPSPSASLLSKADTITQADAICARFKTQLRSVPTPKSESDYPGMKANLMASFALARQFFPEITALVDRSSDAAALHKNWVDVDKADFDATKTAGDQLMAAITKNDNEAIGAGLAAMEKTPDHSAEVAPYLKSYGFRDCYDLENT